MDRRNSLGRKVTLACRTGGDGSRDTCRPGGDSGWTGCGGRGQRDPGEDRGGDRSGKRNPGENRGGGGRPGVQPGRGGHMCPEG